VRAKARYFKRVSNQENTMTKTIETETKNLPCRCAEGQRCTCAAGCGCKPCACSKPCKL